MNYISIFSQHTVYDSTGITAVTSSQSLFACVQSVHILYTAQFFYFASVPASTGCRVQYRSSVGPLRPAQCVVSLFKITLFPQKSSQCLVISYCFSIVIDKSKSSLKLIKLQLRAKVYFLATVLVSVISCRKGHRSCDVTHVSLARP